MKKLIFILSLLIVTISCSSDSDDGMSPTPTPTPTNDVTYNGTVKAIIDGNCLNCHGNPTSNNAPMSLTTLAQVQQAVTSRGLISQVESGAMPQAGTPLSTAQIQAIKDWQTDGFK